MIQQIYPSPAHDFRYELHKDMHFAAAHYIPHPSAGDCQTMHGHTYFADLTIVGDVLDQAGFLVNFAILKQLVHGRFDHTLLNNDNAFGAKPEKRMPTTEVVARIVYETVQAHLDTLPHRPRCLQVFLRETPSSYVIYRPRSER
ncbi:6-carboxytetrahydropterin synthase QueD [Paenibacillus sp. 598K]|uniref:6-pyruvoyl trahydropterin synthase family protein n=1 Tax=Paenibacillus sp. 598K TaxID=1117987 RepID=UPI000FF93C20|nr:6-carboxytetrahydropterin synthase [Paenibacillus sp. 598K]GBF75860.1 6-carboxytetrahydropterin synthase QueD [Paenibacillus sp. 598K]